MKFRIYLIKSIHHQRYPPPISIPPASTTLPAQINMLFISAESTFGFSKSRINRYPARIRGNATCMTSQIRIRYGRISPITGTSINARPFPFIHPWTICSPQAWAFHLPDSKGNGENPPSLHQHVNYLSRSLYSRNAISAPKSKNSILDNNCFINSNNSIMVMNMDLIIILG